MGSWRARHAIHGRCWPTHTQIERLVSLMETGGGPQGCGAQRGLLRVSAYIWHMGDSHTDAPQKPLSTFAPYYKGVKIGLQTRQYSRTLLRLNSPAHIANDALILTIVVPHVRQN